MHPITYLLERIAALTKFAFALPISTAVLLLTFWATFQGAHEMLLQLLISALPPSDAPIARAPAVLFSAAGCLAVAFPLLSSAILSFTHASNWSDDRLHVAMAWSSGILGTILLLVETIGSSEYQYEEVLLAASGVNMLVQELRSHALH